MQISKNKFNQSIIGLSLVTVFLLSFGLAEDAFAVFSPTQPNAYVSYDNSTNQIQVDWDYTTGGVNAPETCLLKGDFWFYTEKMLRIVLIYLMKYFNKALFAKYQVQSSHHK